MLRQRRYFRIAVPAEVLGSHAGLLLSMELCVGSDPGFAEMLLDNEHEQVNILGELRCAGKRLRDIAAEPIYYQTPFVPPLHIGRLLFRRLVAR
ncbi:hypothetical protein BJF84_17300 [Rhodococcus sp. CUA-806]|nr:hypothetical protein BJF84_17300 [Rhodococcus sp. CUA-806]